MKKAVTELSFCNSPFFYGFSQEYHSSRSLISLLFSLSLDLTDNSSSACSSLCRFFLISSSLLIMLLPCSIIFLQYLLSSFNAASSSRNSASRSLERFFLLKRLYIRFLCFWLEEIFDPSCSKVVEMLLTSLRS